MIKNINELNSNQIEVTKDVLKTSNLLNKLDVLMLLLFFPTIILPTAIAITFTSSPTGEMNLDFWSLLLIVFCGIAGALLAIGEQSLICKLQLKLAEKLIQREMNLGSFIMFNANCWERGGDFIPFISDFENIHYETKAKEYVLTFKPCKYCRDIFVETKISKELFDKYEKGFTREYLRAGFMNESVSFIDSNSELFANGLEVKINKKSEE